MSKRMKAGLILMGIIVVVMLYCQLIGAAIRNWRKGD